MRHPWLLLLLPLTVLAACGRNDDLEHRVRNYDVIEEGEAAGVTTSLSGQSVPSLTATNIDTTTDLSLVPGTTETVMTDTAGPESLAETLDVGQAAPPLRGAPAGTDRPSPPPSTGGAPAPARTAPAADTRPRPAPARTEPAPAEPPRRSAPSRPTEPDQTTPEPEQKAPEQKAPEQKAPERKAPEPEAPPPAAEEPPPTTTSTQPEEPPPPPAATDPDGSSREVL